MSYSNKLKPFFLVIVSLYSFFLQKQPIFATTKPSYTALTALAEYFNSTPATEKSQEKKLILYHLLKQELADIEKLAGQKCTESCDLISAEDNAYQQASFLRRYSNLFYYIIDEGVF